MKKTIILALVLFTTVQSYAQQKGEIVLGAHTGFSFTGAIYRLVQDVSESDTLSSGLLSGSNLPVFGASFDYGVSDRFTIGALASVQHFSAKVRENSFSAQDSSFNIRPVDANFNRFYVGIVPKYQYETGSENFEMYSAIRAGFIFWQGNFDAENSNIDALSGFAGGRPALSIVAIGGRYYFNSNLAFNFELATGAPSLLSLGINYKL